VGGQEDSVGGENAQNMRFRHGVGDCLDHRAPQRLFIEGKLLT
jgi:hypothetical protein